MSSEKKAKVAPQVETPKNTPKKESSEKKAKEVVQRDTPGNSPEKEGVEKKAKDETPADTPVNSPKKERKDSRAAKSLQLGVTQPSARDDTSPQKTPGKETPAKGNTPREKSSPKKTPPEKKMPTPAPTPAGSTREIQGAAALSSKTPAKGKKSGLSARSHRPRYHPDVGSDNQSLFGYGSGTEIDDYRRESYSAADDYRRRRYEDFEKMREAYMAEEAEAISPYTFLMVLFALWGVIIALELVIAPYREATHQQITHHVPKTYSLERKHRYFSVATESIDCSLYIKRLRVLHFLDDTIHPIHLTMRQAIMCISFLVPYSAVGMYSTFSMLFFHRLHRQGIEMAKKKRTSKHWVRRNCEHHTLIEFNEVQNSYLRMGNGTADTHLKCFWVENVEQEELLGIWLRNDNAKNPRKFRPSAELRRRMKQNPDAKISRAALESRNLSDPKKGGEQQPLDFIVPSRDMSERLGVFSDGREDASIRHIGLFGDGGVRYVLLPCAPHLSFRPEVIALMFPRAAKGLETTSLLTAFVVAAVLKADLDEPIGKKGLSSRDAEALFTYRMLTAQQLAYEALPSSAEWDNNTNADSILSRSVLEDAVIHLKLSKYVQRTVFVKKCEFDRVTSITTWYRDSLEENACSFTMSTSTPFWLPWTGEKKGDLPPLPVFENTHTKRHSTPFTSAADLIVLQEDMKKVLMQVSASGSLRTLEAVSSVTLRMLRLKEDPGKAIQAPSAFYDPCDEKFYCEDRAIADRLHENHDLTCYPVPESEKHRDRVVMASTVRRSMLEYISAAVSQTPDALNHAAGF